MKYFMIFLKGLQISILGDTITPYATGTFSHQISELESTG